MPLVINTIGVNTHKHAHTHNTHKHTRTHVHTHAHTHTRTHTHTDFIDKNNFKKSDTRRNAFGLKIDLFTN